MKINEIINEIINDSLQHIGKWKDNNDTTGASVLNELLIKYSKIYEMTVPNSNIISQIIYNWRLQIGHHDDIKTLLIEKSKLSKEDIEHYRRVDAIWSFIYSRYYECDSDKLFLLDITETAYFEFLVSQLRENPGRNDIHDIIAKYRELNIEKYKILFSDIYALSYILYVFSQHFVISHIE